MGLLERALQYKQLLNKSGKETLIDRIKGPAETEISTTINVSEIDGKPEQAQDLSDNVDTTKTFFSENVTSNKINENIEEDILLFDDSNSLLNIDETSVTNLIDDISLFDEKLDSNSNLKFNSAELKESVIPEILNQQDSQNATENDIFEMPEFNDYGALYEIQKELINAESIEDIYSTILFSIMGQLGVSSASIIAPSTMGEKKWAIIDSHGIKITDQDFFWNLDEGILQILSTYKGILDIEDIKNDNNLRDDYYKFTAVDARIISPLIREDKLSGAILVGEKINSEEFTPVELEFLQALSDIASSMIASISKYENLATELLGLRIEREILSDVEFFQDSLLVISSINELGEVIRKNFYSLGIESYALFVIDEITKDYYPAYFEADDLMGFAESGFKIKRDNRLITFLLNKKTSIILENFNESNVIIDTFGRSRIAKMDLFVSYPFVISGKLSGFITIFKINAAVNIIDIDIRVQKINRFLFPYLHRIYELDPELNKYIDVTAMLFDRMENEFKQTQELNIPISLILITIKNYKRFYDRFGKIEWNKLSNKTADIIKNRLSEGDFSARLDRNKFLIVLPGKDKRYSVMLSNIVKKEIVENYNMCDFKLLITSNNAVFPEDGKDLFSVLEVLE
jgi:GGDEF domain-containing protein